MSDAPWTEEQVRGEGFAFFAWHCLRWPHGSAYEYSPCRFSKGFLCADMWSNHER